MRTNKFLGNSQVLPKHEAGFLGQLDEAPVQEFLSIFWRKNSDEQVSKNIFWGLSKWT